MSQKRQMEQLEPHPGEALGGLAWPELRPHFGKGDSVYLLCDLRMKTNSRLKMQTFVHSSFGVQLKSCSANSQVLGLRIISVLCIVVFPFICPKSSNIQFHVLGEREKTFSQCRE